LPFLDQERNNNRRSVRAEGKKTSFFSIFFQLLLLHSRLRREAVMAAAASPLAPHRSPPSCDPPQEKEESSCPSEEQAKDSSPCPTSSSLAADAALVVAEAEAPLRWAPPRERWALRKLPQSKEMGPEQLEKALKTAFEWSPALSEELGGVLLSLSPPSKRGGDPAEREARRCLAACLRSAAFLTSGDCEQALRVRLLVRFLF
jgi:hypothetical protein